jgi:MoCo/4Fe-4S cofactor protein with predicted Tat translocation signal
MIMPDSPFNASEAGNATWRSLEELEQSESINEWLHREFPKGAESWGSDQTHRREFLRLMAASMALAGIGGCNRRPEEKIVPTSHVPEYSPHQTLQYATAMPMTGGAQGLLVTSRDGRPLKIEGNPQHPASLGSTDVFAQAAVLELYDPDRSRVVLNHQQVSSWPDFLTALIARVEGHRSRRGKGLRILSPPVLSPTLDWQMHRLQKEMPEARWHHFEPIHDDAEYAGAMLAFGEDIRPHYDFSKATVVLSIDADFLGSRGGKLRHARDFIDQRRNDLNMAVSTSRLYCVESTPSLTGARADHRWPLAPVDVGRFVHVLATKLGLSIDGPQSEEFDGVPAGVWDALVADLKQNPTGSLVVAGPYQPAEVVALVHAINVQLGAVGHTVTYHRPVAATNRGEGSSLSALTTAMQGRQVESLLILDGNPVFDAPADLDFVAALASVKWSVHVGVYADETSAACTWHVPAAHFLESWGDSRSDDGTASLIQPLIAPLHGGRSVVELVNVLLDEPRSSACDTLRAYWRDQHGEEDFEAFWNRSLHDGVISDTAFPKVEPTLRSDLLPRIARALKSVVTGRKPGTITAAIFRPHPTLWDGRFANNGWLQELPQPFSTLTWSNAAYVSPADASALGYESGDVVEVIHDGRSIRTAVCVLPGQVRGVITLRMGGGRHRAGRVGSAVGANVFPLRTTDNAWLLWDVVVKRTDAKQRLAATQQHFLMEGRDLIKSGKWDDYRADPAHPAFMGHEAEPHDQFSFYPAHPDGISAENQWGMSINLGACIGCNACVIACQAENNTPVVGATQVALGREMHWLRVATYFTGSPDAPQIDHQPVPCMHCEHAPCEVVCPVAATTHSKEGLNEMTYNRCVGTRYCSNNCPYKVRRFNFLDYHSELREEPLLQLLPNPEVTVRSRGVMEKCTYCVQRISAARINAGLQDRSIADGDVVTACQAVCPTRAISFGNIRDPQSVVATEKQSTLSYSLLAELNTRPRTTYLASLRNPHPDLAKD